MKFNSLFTTLILLVVGSKNNVLGFHQLRKVFTTEKLHFQHNAAIIQESLSLSWEQGKKLIISCLLIPAIFMGGTVKADDELANYASQGNKVGVDGMCFIRKCALETSKCGNNPNCLKGLSCLSRCKGASLCSTGCFAKYGGDDLDNLLYCSVEKNDCVHVPRTSDSTGWAKDKLSDLPAAPMASFRPSSLRGTWYKIMGLDSRYDCFDCQKNAFNVQNKKTLEMKALFRIPRPTFPGYLQSSIKEELIAPDPSEGSLSHLQSQGKMFGLTFWENWYILGEHNFNTVKRERAVMSENGFSGVMRALAFNSGGPQSARAVSTSEVDVAVDVEVDGESTVGTGQAIGKGETASTTTTTTTEEASATPVFTRVEEQEPDLKLVFYTGHTLQGNYKGAFLYSRSPTVTPRVTTAAKRLISRSGLNPSDFCIVRNTCFLSEDGAARDTDPTAVVAKKRNKIAAPFWYIGQRYFQDTEVVGKELADWFQDPMILSDWLVNQQQRMILRQPLEVSPFASLSNDFAEESLR